MKCILKKEIASEQSVKLLDTEIDNHLNFDNHVSTLRKIIHGIKKIHWFS